MQSTQAAIRKAAILVAGVDRNTADLLLRQMPPAEAAAVRRAVLQLDDIEANERDTVLTEFRQLTVDVPLDVSAPREQSPPIEVARTVLRQLVPHRVSAGIDLSGPEARRLCAPLDSSPAEVSSAHYAGGGESSGASAIEWLRHAGTEAVADFLAHEHPQTIAVILSQIDPQQAAEVLTRLPDDVQVAVVRRLTELGEMDPAVIREVEVGLQSWLSDHFARRQRRVAGLSAVTRILDAVDASGRRDVLANLDRLDRDLAARLGCSLPAAAPRPRQDSVSFDDLFELNDVDLATLFAAAERQTAVLALAGCGTDILTRIIRKAPANDAAELREGVSSLGPAKLCDLEAAQQQIVALALEMESDGLLQLGSLRTCSVIA